MRYVNTYAATLPLHERGFYKAILAQSDDKVDFGDSFIRKITTDQLSEEFIWLSGLPRAVSLRDGQEIPLASITTPYTKKWFTEEFGIGIELTRKQLRTDQSGMIGQMGKYLGISHYNTEQRLYASLLNNGTNGSYTGPNGKVLFATDNPIGNGNSYSNLSTSQAFSPDAVMNMMTDVGLHRTWQDEPWVETFGWNLVYHQSLEFQAGEIMNSVNKGQEFSNTSNELKKGIGGGTVQMTRGNPFLEDTNAFYLIPRGKGNPLFCLEGMGLEVYHDGKTRDFTGVWTSMCDRTVGWMHTWGVQANLGA